MSAADGAEQFYRLSKALKAAGEKDLRNELNRRIRIAARPVIADIRAAAIAGLPREGGLGTFISKKQHRVVTRTGRNPGVGIRINKQDPRLDTEGRLGHPVFNRRDKAGKRVYVVQQVRPGVLSEGFQSAAPRVRDDIVAAINSVQDEIVGRV